MAPRNTISQLTSRIDDLTERLPSRKRTMICGGSDAECRGEAGRDAGGRQTDRANVLFVIIDTSGEVRP